MTSRRDFLALSLLGLAKAGSCDAAVTSSPAKPSRATRPIIIAHRGASGYRPEHTRSAYELAIDQGCDFIEPDLVVTSDGHLVARHENEIGATTNIALHEEFAGRKTTKVIDGTSITGWFTEDFTLAELKTLRCRERLPQLRPLNTRFDNREQILTLAEVMSIAKAGSQRTGRVIGIYPEMKHPTYFSSIDLPVEDRLVAALKNAEWASRTSPVIVQCFEVRALKAIGRLADLHLIQLIASEGGPADLNGARYADMISPMGLRVISTYASGIAPDRSLVLSVDASGQATPTRLVADAHASRLAVHCWTLRAENSFLPEAFQRGDPTSATYAGMRGRPDLLARALFNAGVDGLFSDFPDIAAAQRSPRG
jgi:glycerophosphoryl diester phosphodiesterase